MKLQNLVSKLEKRHKKKIDLSLDRTFNLLKKLGNPQNKLKNIVTIVGTNSKASMAYGLKSILNEAGYKCNLYTSPHLQSYTERFIFDDKDNVMGIEKGNPLSLSRGKVELVRSLNLGNDIIIVGDGYTDYEIKKFNVAKYFLAYTAHVKRDNVVKNADVVCNDFYDVIKFLNKKYT